MNNNKEINITGYCVQKKSGLLLDNEDGKIIVFTDKGKAGLYLLKGETIREVVLRGSVNV